MKAIILVAGVGKRMGNLTIDKPKCLVEVNGAAILGRLLSQLSNQGINDIILVTGPFEEKIKQFVNTNFPELSVLYVNNSRFNTTNYIYSLWLTKDCINDGVLLLHGDLILEEHVLKKLIKTGYENCVLVNNVIEVPEKDFKARIRNGIVSEIGVNVFGDDAYFLLPLYKFSRKGFLRWLNEIETFISRGETNCYAENAFNLISNELKLYPVYYDSKLCMEIDTLQDLKLAETNFK